MQATAGGSTLFPTCGRSAMAGEDNARSPSECALVKMAGSSVKAAVVEENEGQAPSPSASAGAIARNSARPTVPMT